MNSTLAEDPVNRLLLSIAEDRLSGFHERPLEVLASRCELPTQEVRKRLVSLLRGGIVRAVRQTLPSTSFTRSCLVAWHLPEDALESAFDWLVRHDPFSGHVVLRETEDPSSPGAEFRLWTTLRLPAPEGNPEEHCRILSPVTLSFGRRRILPSFLPRSRIPAVDHAASARAGGKSGGALSHPVPLHRCAGIRLHARSRYVPSFRRTLAAGRTPPRDSGG